MGYLRRNLINQQNNLLPTIYERVGYIVNEAGAYFDTDYIIQINPKVEITYRCRTNLDSDLFGFVNKIQYVYNPANFGKLSYVKYNFNSNSLNLTNDISNPITISFSNELIYNGSAIYKFDYSDTVKDHSIFLYKSRSNSEPTEVYKMNIYDGDILKCSLVPVRNRETNVYGFYDIIRHRFFTSQTSKKLNGHS